MINTSNHLLIKPDKKVGFYTDGSMAKSVTNAITIELEKQRLMRMDILVKSSLRRDDYEKSTWGGYSATSAAFLQALPDRIGYTGDNMFQVAMTTYLVQPCPIIAPLVVRYSGKKGANVDKYRANLTATVLLG